MAAPIHPGSDPAGPATATPEIESVSEAEAEAEAGADYPGHDGRPTSRPELWGWYSYGIASEVFAVCAVGSFLPVVLERLARERGVLRADGSTRCVGPASPSASPSASDPAPAESTTTTTKEAACVVDVAGLSVDSASFAMYTVAAAVLVQLLVLISVGAVADHGSHRKHLLVTFAAVGSAACMLFLFVSPPIFLAAPVLTIISITCLGNSYVLLNAFLPLLVANSPLPEAAVVPTGSGSGYAWSKGGESETDADAGSIELAPLRPANPDPTAHPDQPTKPARQSNLVAVSNRISATGVALGYAAAVFAQLMSILILLRFRHSTDADAGTDPSSQTLPVRAVLFFVGLWWALFSVPTAVLLRSRPGPPLPIHHHHRHHHHRSIVTTVTTITSTVAFSWRSLGRTVKSALRLRHLARFLLGWFLLSDSMATVSGTAILFARTELKMGTAAVAMVSITATLSGIAGAVLWPWLDRRWHRRRRTGTKTLSPSSTSSSSSATILIFIILLFAFIPLYALLAFVPPIRRLGFGGLQQQWEIYPLAVVHGLVMGGLSSLARSLYSVLIPPGHEAAFFALYAVTDKGSSVIGPVLVGLVVDTWGEIRYAFWGLVVMVLLPVPVFWRVDLDVGKEEALRERDRLKATTTTTTRSGLGYQPVASRSRPHLPSSSVG